ncbi:COP23 domain-containing protein [Alkalinema pantanalense CENA528]|uniref:COP23 domain-containing protein n=1 Tax=Alkalinema pantanalense TaxID=1620705 RepID=UPI003D6FAD1E
MAQVHRFNRYWLNRHWSNRHWLNRHWSNRHWLNRNLGRSIVLGVLAIGSAMSLLPMPSQAATFPDLVFECPNGSRTLVARSVKRRRISKPILQFTGMGKFSAAQRCREVAARFNFLNSSNSEYSLAYLTTGIRKNQPIVCSVEEYGAPCNQTEGVQILTLSPRDRSPARRDYALSQILVRLHHAATTTPILVDSPPAQYLNLQELIQQSLQATEGEQAESTP